MSNLLPSWQKNPPDSRRRSMYDTLQPSKDQGRPRSNSTGVLDSPSKLYKKTQRSPSPSPCFLPFSPFARTKSYDSPITIVTKSSPAVLGCGSVMNNISKQMNHKLLVILLLITLIILGAGGLLYFQVTPDILKKVETLGHYSNNRHPRDLSSEEINRPKPIEREESAIPQGSNQENVKPEDSNPRLYLMRAIPTIVGKPSEEENPPEPKEYLTERDYARIEQLKAENLGKDQRLQGNANPQSNPSSSLDLERIRWEQQQQANKPYAQQQQPYAQQQQQPQLPGNYYNPEHHFMREDPSIHNRGEFEARAQYFMRNVPQQPQYQTPPGINPRIYQRGIEL